MLVRHHDAARTPLVEEPCHGVSRSREPRVDELIAHEEYEDRVSHRGAPPGPQANEFDVVKHVERAVCAARSKYRSALMSLLWSFPPLQCTERRGAPSLVAGRSDFCTPT